MSTDTDTTPQELTFRDEMHKMQHEQMTTYINERNALVGKANAAHGDRLTLTEQIRENSTDPDIVEAREAMSAWALKLDELVKPEVDAIVENAQGSVEETEKKIAEIDQILKPGLTYYKRLYPEDAVKALPTQARLAGTAVRSSTGGGRRIRGFNVIVTIDGESKEFENFASASKHLGVDTGDLQEAFFNKAGTTVLKDVPDTVTLVINFTEVDDDNNSTDKEATVKAYRTEASTGTDEPVATEETPEDVNPEEL